MGGSRGLVIMGGGEFEFRHWMDIFTFVAKIVKDENKWKRGEDWPIFKKREHKPLGEGSMVFNLTDSRWHFLCRGGRVELVISSQYQNIQVEVYQCEVTPDLELM